MTTKTSTATPGAVRAAREIISSEVFEEFTMAEIIDRETGSPMRELEQLTPGGSEFAGDAKRCADYVREKIESLQNISKALVIQNNRLRETGSREMLEALEALLDIYPFPKNTIEAAIYAEARAAIQKAKGL